MGEESSMMGSKGRGFEVRGSEVRGSEVGEWGMTCSRIGLEVGVPATMVSGMKVVCGCV